jgi:hypothetical protein
MEVKIFLHKKREWNESDDGPFAPSTTMLIQKYIYDLVECVGIVTSLHYSRIVCIWFAKYYVLYSLLVMQPSQLPF